MFEPLGQLPLSNLIYLGGVVVAFVSFGAALASAHLWSNLPVSPRPSRSEPAVRPAARSAPISVTAG